ncbi:MAG TPA: hypothetical protein VI168_11325 [Croceibacterium sp.]
MRLTAKPFLTGTAVLALAALGACVPTPEPTPTPVPAPAPAPAPRPAPPPAPPPFAGHWMDAPLTPGDWRYAAGVATFSGGDGSPLLVLRCAAGTGALAIERTGVGNEFAPTLVVRAESVSRSLSPTTTGQGVGGAGGWTVAALPVQDALLDAIAFSKGRFAIESAGLATLYVPPYPEITRVIEDCR